MDGPLRYETHRFLRKEFRQKITFFALVIGTYCSLKSTNFKTQIILSKASEKARTLITTKAEFIGNVNRA